MYPKWKNYRPSKPLPEIPACAQVQVSATPRGTRNWGTKRRAPTKRGACGGQTQHSTQVGTNNNKRTAFNRVRNYSPAWRAGYYGGGLLGRHPCRHRAPLGASWPGLSPGLLDGDGHALPADTECPQGCPWNAEQFQSWVANKKGRSGENGGFSFQAAT